MNKLVNTIVKSVKNGGKVLICGNGGLAAESSHFAAELMGKYAFFVYVPCVDLTSNNALITALANDIGFDDVFSHQVRVSGKRGDILIGMTTSASHNIRNAIFAGYENKLVTVVIGVSKTDIKADYKIIMKGNDTATIQNNTIKYLHKLAYEIKKKIQENK